MNQVFVGTGIVAAKHPMQSEDELDEIISVRISKGDRAEIHRLAKALALKPMTIARIALRSGLHAIERDPGRTLREVATPPPPARVRRKPRKGG